MVRAKFRVMSITRSESGFVPPGQREMVTKEVQTIALVPVYAHGDPNHENSKFWAATPSGEIKLGVVNAEAAAGFELGREYYVDFTPAA